MRSYVIALLLCASTAHAEPTATEHYEAGKALFERGDFAAAIAKFEAARALDPQPRYVYNLAQAQRRAGRCEEAIASYRDFLASDPPEDRAAIARSGIDKCEAILATTVTRAQPQEPPPRDTRPTPPPPVPPRTITVREREPWYRDAIGDALTGAGAATLIASSVFALNARAAARATYEPGTLDRFEHNRERAAHWQGLTVISGGIGIALVTGGIVRYALRPSHERVIIIPSGTGVAVEGRF